MYDEKSDYPKKEIGFAFKPHINNLYAKAFSDQTSNQDGNENSFSKIKYYNPPNLLFQHLPVKGKVKNIELNRMRNGFIINTLLSIDTQKIAKIGGKVIQIYENVFFIKKTLRCHDSEK